MNRSSYRIVEDIPGQPLVIEDVGRHDHQPTVTNDAENVVWDLHEKGRLPKGRRLLYYDSEGRLDELLHEDGQFSGFAPGPRQEAAP